MAATADLALNIYVLAPATGARALLAVASRTRLAGARSASRIAIAASARAERSDSASSSTDSSSALAARPPPDKYAAKSSALIAKSSRPMVVVSSMMVDGTSNGAPRGTNSTSYPALNASLHHCDWRIGVLTWSLEMGEE